MLKRSDGFTLIELLVVISVVAILAAVALPRLDSARQEAHFATVGQDLRNLGGAQERFHQGEGHYAQSLGALGYQGSDGVEMDVIPQSSDQGWAAVATHEALDPGRGCGMYLGSADPPPLPNGEVHSGGAGVLACVR